MSHPAATRTVQPGRLIWPVNAALATALTALWASGVAPALVGPTALLGSLLLLFTLLPANLLRFDRLRGSSRLRALARRRRGLGISAGFWFVAHSLVATPELIEGPRGLLGELTSPEIFLGVVATLVFVALLATSTDRARRALGSNWKRLHRLVWFAVPFALLHTVLSNLRFEGHLEPPSIVLLTSPLVFAVVELARARDRAGAMTHIALVVAGSTSAALIALAL